MRAIRDTSRGDWLIERAGTWATVGGVAATGFEAYARILHPVQAWQEDLTVSDEWGQHPTLLETRWGWAEVARRNGRTMHPLVQWFSLTDDEERRDFDDGWHVGQSVDGRLAVDLLAALARMLHGHTSTPDEITAGIWHGWGELHPESGALLLLGSDDITPNERARIEREWRAERRRSVARDVRELIESGPQFDWPGREMLLLETSLHELSDIEWPARAGLAGVVPQMLWPADNRWVVASEIDWDSTIVAGSRALIDAIVAFDSGEAFEVDEQSDLTGDGDTINPHPPGRMSP